MAAPSNAVSWKYLSLEAALIVLSVLIGFGVQEWRQSQKDEEAARRAREAIRREIEANRADMQELLEMHRRQLRQVREVSGDSLRLGWGRSTLRNSAWETAQSTGAASELDYDVAEAAALVHQLQTYHREFDQTVAEMLYQMILSSDEDIRVIVAKRKGAIGPMLGNMVSAEQSLLRAYDDALTVLGDSVAASDSTAAQAANAAP